jgi:zeaxanthin glucosyltransferase
MSARVLIMTCGFKGEVNPRIPVAHQLLDSNAEVRWLATSDPGAQLASAGIEVMASPPGVYRTMLRGEARQWIVNNRDDSFRASYQFYVEDMPARVDLVRPVVREYQPDVMLIEGWIYEGILAAALEGVPWVNTSANLTLIQPEALAHQQADEVRTLASGRARLFARFGVPDAGFRGLECVSPWSNTVFTTTELVGGRGWVPPRTHMVGPSIGRRARGDEVDMSLDFLDPSRPLVFITSGSRIRFELDLYRRAAAAALQLGAQVLVSAGDFLSTLRDALPPEVFVDEYVPQLAALERASVVISHGGANTVMEALYHGVPMILSPVTTDGPVQAFFVEQAGAGAIVAASATQQEWHELLARMFEPVNGYRATCAAIRRSYRASDGAREAARRILDVANHRG